MPNGSLSLAEYPAAMVRLKCAKCERSGQYRKATLIEKYGRDIPLPDLLHLVGAKAIGVSVSAISNAIKRNGTAGGYYWRFVEDR